MELSNQICDGIFLGGVLSALNEKDLREKNISHILTVTDAPLPQMLTRNYNYKFVYALDLSDSDLLCFFPETFSFIEEAKNEDGKVLVHCHSGISRSVTIVAAYLMKKLKIGKKKALEIITQKSPTAKPNVGFQEQLQLYENIGCNLIEMHRDLCSYRLNKFSALFKKGLPECTIPEEVLLKSEYASNVIEASFKCRKCRMFLFRQAAINTHYVGDESSTFQASDTYNSQFLPSEESDHAICTHSFFVSPLDWMRDMICSSSGKLHCPKCCAKIGSFVWNGKRCPCGAWVSPAFHVDRGKVDEIPFRPPMPQIHYPVIPRSLAAAHSNTQSMGLTRACNSTDSCD